MMRKLVSVLLLSAVSAGALALGLGNIQLNSGLNQPFDARIVLLSPSASELDSLVIRLADPDAFSRAGIERSFVLTTLRFEVQQNENGEDYIRVSSREPLREPFLNFLIEASWSNGKLFREYTVLLDPPLYDPNAGRAATPATAQPSQPTSPSGSADISPASGAAAVASSAFSGNEVGPIAASETLWAVASRVRPDDSVSVNQMMVALLRANPEAFIGNNINGLKQGQILRVPGMDEISSTTSRSALEEVRSQNAMWEEIRTGIAAATTTRPVAASADTASETPAAGSAPGGSTAGSSPELRLLSPGDQAANVAGQSGTDAASGGTNAGASLMNEQMESLSSENADLRDRLTESEQIIQDLRRLIELKDDELATMQQRINNAPAGTVAAEQTAQAEVVEEAVTPVQGEAGAETALETDTAVEQQAGAEVDAAAEAPTEDTPIEAEASVDGTTDTGDASEVAPAEDLPAEEAAVEEPSDPAPMIEVDTASDAGLVGQILGFIFGNILLVGGGLVVIVLLALVPAILRKRKEAAGEAELAAQVDFPDFDAPSAGTDTSDGPQMDVDIEKEISDQAAPAGEPASSVDEAQAVPLDVAPAASTAGAEEDPLAEVNVFLAYEHFDQAEEFVRDAITRQPENLDFHSKLLEVFYSAGERGKYEQEARVLHDLTGGAGPHWDMATIMWQEMSPNRPLFSEPAEGEEDSRSETTGTGRGIVDLTADNDAADDSALDFDLGMAIADSAPAAKAAGTDDMLDITAGSEDVLDVTASEARETEEDILDVTAAVGLDTVPVQEEGLSFDLPATDDQDILDISKSGTDDLLDVTAHTDIEEDQDENLLDISMAGSTVGNEAGSSADDNLLDFDVAGLSDTAAEETATTDSDDGLELDLGSQTDAGDDLELSLDMDSQAEDGSLEFSLDSGTTDTDGGIELDFASGEEDAGSTEDGISLDFDMADELATPPASGIDIDMDSTVKIPKSSEISLDFAGDDEDDDDNHTVFVPRTNDTGEQSADDENATKLDLAKAYVELGDKSNARTILEEVIAAGNAMQRRQAEELMAQI